MQHLPTGQGPHRAPELELLFDDVGDVAVFVSRELITGITLPPQEAEFISRAVPARQAEFATGRLCARAAIEAIGSSAPSLPVGAGRQPEWPNGITAAITHTRREGRQFVAAVASHDVDRTRGVGIDAEVIQPLKDGVREMLLVPAEIEAVEALPFEDRDEAAIRVFSAKEAFYKAQYALTSGWVGFQDMRLSSLEGTGELLQTGNLDVLDAVDIPVRFRQVTTEGLVISAVSVQRRQPAG